jgi:hypothetical protein
MEKNKEDALNQFLGEYPKPLKQPVDQKEAVLEEREGLIERVDKILVTSEGKQLLREVY